VTKDRSVYIRHIYDCIGWINEYVQAGKDEFFHDRKTQDAVIRNLEVIGSGGGRPAHQRPTGRGACATKASLVIQQRL
jgi:uncharacterized protein with HEPN domain